MLRFFRDSATKAAVDEIAKFTDLTVFAGAGVSAEIGLPNDAGNSAMEKSLGDFDAAIGDMLS